MGESFHAALERLTDEKTPFDAFGRPFLGFLPISGAAVSTLGDVLGNETVSATDDRAARLDELQFDLGEGPCWDAMRLARPVLEPRLLETSRWPTFAAAVREYDVCSIFAFPVSVGALQLGAVDLYSVEPSQLSGAQTRQASTMADVIGRRLLRDALADSGEEEQLSPHSRRVIHQATGIVLAQLELSPEDAELMIKGHAFATNCSMMDVSSDITAGRLAFGRRRGAIEVIT